MSFDTVIAAAQLSEVASQTAEKTPTGAHATSPEPTP
jgi:hypothetical protein